MPPHYKDWNNHPQKCSNPQQSAKLLGILGPDTADMYYPWIDTEEESGLQGHYVTRAMFRPPGKTPVGYLCWSLPKLIELLPAFLTLNASTASSYEPKKDLGAILSIQKGSSWHVTYHYNPPRPDLSPDNLWTRRSSLSLFDAVYQMVLFIYQDKELIKNKYF